MRIVCGDDNGLVKSVQAFPPVAAAAEQSGRQKNDGKSERTKARSGTVAQRLSNNVVKIWGSQNREAQIQSLCWAQDAEQEQVMDVF